MSTVISERPRSKLTTKKQMSFVGFGNKTTATWYKETHKGLMKFGKFEGRKMLRSALL